MTIIDIPNVDSDLRVSEDTTVAEVTDYLTERLSDPAVVEGSVVWSFHSQGYDAQALIDSADDLDEGKRYIIPYQVPGLWGFMVGVLPDYVANATLLTYRHGSGTYATYPNLRQSRPSATQAEMIRSAAAEGVSDHA